MNRTGDMTPQRMVLGVVAMGSGTVADIQRRLVDLFPSAGFARGAAHDSLPSLADQGYVHLVEAGAWPAQNRYEIAEAGVGEIRDWVSSPPPVPVIRDAIHGKVELAEPGELPGVVRLVRVQQEFCEAACEKAHEQMQAEKRLLQKVPPKGWREELDAARRIAHLKHLKLSWADAAARRKAFADELDDIYDRFVRTARSAGEDG